LAALGDKVGKVTVVDAVSLADEPTLSLAQIVEAPVPAVYSWALNSVLMPETLPEKPTVMVEDPVVEMVPSHSSTSRFWVASEALVSLVQVAPPPETEETETDDELICTASTKASPAVWGETDKVVSAVPKVEARLPTAEMFPEGDDEDDIWVSSSAVL
jgi:hypothetical protein